MSSTTPPSITDQSLTFLLQQGAMRGRLVRLGETTREILTRHDYPPVVARLVAETAALACALAFALKFEGIFTLQAQGSGPVTQLVADVTSTGNVRAHARFDEEAVRALEVTGEESSVQKLLGVGNLAFTVDQDTHRYQGIVELAGATLADCVQRYFRQSEQIETALKVVAVPVDGPAEQAHVWSAAVLMLQRMPGSAVQNLDAEELDDLWRTAVVLLSSLTGAELGDPSLSAETLLHRLFHQEGLGVPAEPVALRFGCRCSRDRVEETLKSFPRSELRHMRHDDGSVSVECQFCSSEYLFSEAEVEAILSHDGA